MKKILKKSNIFSFIIGAVVFGGIGTVLAYNLFANQIGYTPTDTTWKKANGDDIRTVEDAIEELYSEKQDATYVKGGIKVSSGSTISVDVGSFIVISSVDSASVTNSTTVVAPAWYSESHGVGAWSSVHRATSDTVKITINGNFDFVYYIFK